MTTTHKADFISVAAEALERGFPITVILPDEKRPLFKKWNAYPTTSLSFAQQWALEFPSHHVGVVGTRGIDKLMFLDIDADGVEERIVREILARTGLRIGEAIAIKWSDLEGNVLHVQRRLYQGKADSLKTSSSERRLPLSGSLVERVNALRWRFPNSEWMFCSETGTTPVNPGNALQRYIRPAVKGLGISLGGWHDFRHTLTTTLRRDGVHPKIISGILGHSKVNIAMDVYDHATVQDFQQPLERLAA